MSQACSLDERALHHTTGTFRDISFRPGRYGSFAVVTELLLNFLNGTGKQR